MKTLLFTTSVLSDESLVHLNNLYESVFKNASVHINIEHIFLLQNPLSQDLPNLPSSKNYNITVLTLPKMVSLSEARNIMLKHAKDNDLISHSDIVAFPDDDCWYPEQNLSFIFNVFEQSPTLDLFFCKYRQALHEKPLISNIQYKIDTKTLIKNASSNTIFLRGHIVNELQGFDRQLGVGAPNNGGEDLDYAIRSYLKAQNTGFLNSYIIGHRNKDTTLRGKYYRGSAIVLNRYKFESLGLFIQSVRKNLIGLYLLIRKELPFSELKKSFHFVKANSKL